MGDSKTWCIIFFLKIFFFQLFFNLSSKYGSNFCVFCSFLVKARPKLKSKYKGQVEATSDYARTIDDFDALLILRPYHVIFLVPKPSSYILLAIEKEEKSKPCENILCSCVVFMLILIHIVVSEMTTKFNHEMYARSKVRRMSLYLVLAIRGLGWLMRRSLKQLRLYRSL